MPPRCWRPRAISDLSHAIRAALLTGDKRGKVKATRALVRAWRRGELPSGWSVAMPERPRWPGSLQVLPPARMPKRGRGGSERNRIALWHSLAHIEFVAIDLALDMIGRFGGQMDESFTADFLDVATEEAMHFALIDRHLASMGAGYGDLPVHDGLWQAAEATAHDVAARLAVVPMVLEARGLDVTPAMIERVRSMGDSRGERILARVLDDEIRHVSAGTRHFAAICAAQNMELEKYWKNLVREHFQGTIRAPFNDSARLRCGLSRDAYTCLLYTSPSPRD